MSCWNRESLILSTGRSLGDYMKGRAELTKGAVIDLDDTLYPQATFLEGAVHAVTATAVSLGFDGASFAAVLQSVLDEASDTGRTIDETLERLACSSEDVDLYLPALVQAFIGFRPASLDCYVGVLDALASMARVMPLACLTDGNPVMQRAKITALKIEQYFSLVVITDELGGRAHRKPDLLGITFIAESFGVSPRELVVIGDRPDKDVIMALRSGSSVVRVQQGEYQRIASPNEVATAPDFPSAAAMVLGARKESAVLRDADNH